MIIKVVLDVSPNVSEMDWYVYVTSRHVFSPSFCFEDISLVELMDLVLYSHARWQLPQAI